MVDVFADAERGQLLVWSGTGSAEDKKRTMYG